MHFYTGLASFVFFYRQNNYRWEKTDKINQIILWTNKIKMQQNRICLLDCGELCWFIYEWTARSEQVGSLPVFGLLSVQSIMVAPDCWRIEFIESKVWWCSNDIILFRYVTLMWTLNSENIVRLTIQLFKKITLNIVDNSLRHSTWKFQQHHQIPKIHKLYFKIVLQ